MADKLSIGIVGAGAIGTALGRVFKSCGYPVTYWDEVAAKSTAPSLEALVESSQLLLLCIPSWANQAVAAAIAKTKDGAANKLVLSTAKGVGPGFALIPDILRAAGGRYDYGVLYGPMLAQEIIEGKRAAAILAVSARHWLNCLNVEGSQFYISYSGDVKSIALCGVLKNIYAVGFGINDGLELGHNSKGQLMVMAMHEIQMLLSSFGADPAQAFGLAGLGDLLATGWSQDSFNYRIGKALAEGLAASDAKGEGVNSLKELAATTDLKDLPLVAKLQQIIVRQAPASSLGDVLG